MHLVVPASGICGAVIIRGKYVPGGTFGNLFSTRLCLSSFSLTIGMENLRLQNIQRPTEVNVSMQVTSMETIKGNGYTEKEFPRVSPWDGSQVTPWARSVKIPSSQEIYKPKDYNELYVILKPNQGHYYPKYISNDTRADYQVIRVLDITFDIPEYSAVSRTESATLNTFTLNGVADAREPVLIGPANEVMADQILCPFISGSMYPYVPVWPLSGRQDVYAVLQTGEIYP